ncbi:hypothetical protein VTL71DRAFT_10982 [Oculimacula yallundae]|uniref:Uncharacterized protein n=1 Tax=Oculimacula yallundae TaxID=86028 RepID=A0ABR4CW39_9HELO
MYIDLITTKLESLSGGQIFGPAPFTKKNLPFHPCWWLRAECSFIYLKHNNRSLSCLSRSKLEEHHVSLSLSLADG